MVPERHTIFQVWHIRPLCHLSKNRVAAVFGRFWGNPKKPKTPQKKEPPILFLYSLCLLVHLLQSPALTLFHFHFGFIFGGTPKTQKRPKNPKTLHKLKQYIRVSYNFCFSFNGAPCEKERGDKQQVCWNWQTSFWWVINQISVC